MRHAVRLVACGWMVLGMVSLVGAQQLGQPRQAPPQPRQQAPQPRQQPQQLGQPPAAAAAVVAVVNDDPITQQELAATLQIQLQGRQVDPQAAQQLQQQVLQSLVESRLVEQYVLEHGPDVEQEKLQAALAELQRQIEAQGLSLPQFLAERGQTLQSLQQRMHGSLAWREFQEQELTEPKLREFFERYSEKFQAETFEEARPQVVQVQAGELWADVVQKMRPEAEIKMAGPPQQTPQDPRQAPAPRAPGQP